MYDALVHLLQGLKPPYILLVQACIIVAFPYFLWRTLRFGAVLPLGVVQILAGVLLGPAIFGFIDATLLNPSPPPFDPSKAVNACTNPQARELFNALFGRTCYNGQLVDRSGAIAAVANIAVCLFGFLAGTDADKELIRKSGKSIVSIGFNGFVFGWLLAAVAGYIIYLTVPRALGGKADWLNFSMGYGLVIAVSALPVLALILRGLEITRRRMGAVALASASIADTMMWVGLGITVALALGGSLPVALTRAFLGGALSIVFIKYVASPWLERMLRNEAPESAIITITALSIFVASAITGITELHPVLGAFIAGYFLPDKVRELASHRIDQTTVLILMPFFFLNTGLRTDFALYDPTVWILFTVSTFLCVFGKMIGHGVAARLTGESWPFAMSIGLLLQTKGLMGLIVLNVFFEKEVISQLMFSAAVLMCIASTALTTPLMRLMFRRFGDDLKDGGAKPDTPQPADAGPIVAQTQAAAAAAAASPPMARVEFEQEFGVFNVNRGAVTIGRHSENDLQINDIRVSRHHARMTVTHDGRFQLHNLTADKAVSNPITVNGVEREHAVLAEGDKVVLGGGPAFVIRYATKPANG